MLDGDGKPRAAYCALTNDASKSLDTRKHGVDFANYDGGDDPSLKKVGHQPVEAAKLQIPPKDGPDPLGLLFNHDDLAVLGLVSERRHAADPKSLALGGRDLVADALGGHLSLELGE